MKLLAAALALATVTSAHAAITTVDFDSPPDPFDITSAYPGLTLLASKSGTGPVRTFNALDHTFPRSLGLSNASNMLLNDMIGGIDIFFASPVSFVSIHAMYFNLISTSPGSGLPYLSIHDSTTISDASRIGLVNWEYSGTLTCGAGDANNCPGVYEELAFTSATADILAIRLSGSLSDAVGGPQRVAIFDTLSYGTEDTQTVPEPASLLLLGLTLLGLGAMRHRASR